MCNKVMVYITENICIGMSYIPVGHVFKVNESTMRIKYFVSTLRPESLSAGWCGCVRLEEVREKKASWIYMEEVAAGLLQCGP